MTVTTHAPPLVVADLDSAIRALRERGLRISTSRRLVLEALFAAEQPVSAEPLARDLGLDPSSVYRSLETLERHGLVRHVHLGHGPGLYALVADRELEYLCCERCGAVTPVEAERLDPVRAQIRAQFGYEACFTHFAIVGLCRSCATSAATAA
jgi:Fur family transcriptional regulator, ferric uptake regulator